MALIIGIIVVNCKENLDKNCSQSSKENSKSKSHNKGNYLETSFLGIVKSQKLWAYTISTGNYDTGYNAPNKRE